MKCPLVILTPLLSLGILVAHNLKISFTSVYFIAIIFLILCFLSFNKKLVFDIFLYCLIFLLGIVILKSSQSLPKCHISKYAYYKNDYLYTLKGFITREPILKNNKIIFVLRTQKIYFDNFKSNVCGDILTYIRGRKDLHYGDEIMVTGSLYHPFNRLLSGSQSYRDYLSHQGIYAIMNVSLPSRVIKSNNSKGFVFKKLALRLKAKMEIIIFKYLSPLAASILDAMILGERRNIPPLIYNSMVKSGTVHILVVSGFNVGIVFFIIILFLKLLRLPRRIRICVAIPILIFYCLLTGASNPVVRATVMAIVFLLTYLFKREPDIYNSLAIAALVILSNNPQQLFEVGFQLSFASVISIVYFYPKIKSLLRLESLRIKFIRFLIEGCIVSFSAWLGTVGLIAYYFKIFSPLTILANIFVVPLATLITLCGFSLIIIGLLNPHLATLFALSCELLATFLININSLLIKIPGAYFYLS